MFPQSLHTLIASVEFVSQIKSELMSLQKLVIFLQTFAVFHVSSTMKVIYCHQNFHALSFQTYISYELFMEFRHN